MKRGGIIAGALLAAAVFAFWWFSTSQVVKRRIHGLFDTVSFSEGLGTGSRTLRAGSIERHLAAEVTLGTPDERADGSYGRDDIVSGFLYFMRQARESRFEDVSIRSLEIDGDSARARVAFFAHVIFPQYEPLHGHYEATVTLRNQEDGWRVDSARIDP